MLQDQERWPLPWLAVFPLEVHYTDNARVITTKLVLLSAGICSSGQSACNFVAGGFLNHGFLLRRYAKDFNLWSGYPISI